MAEAKVKNVSLTNLDTIARVGAEEQLHHARRMSRGCWPSATNPSDESWITKGGTN